MLKERHGDTNLLHGISRCQKHTEGGTGVAEEPREDASLLSPLLSSTAHQRRCKVVHLATMNSKGTFLLSALLEK